MNGHSTSIPESYLLNSFIYRVRVPLQSIKGASQIATLMSEQLPVSVSNWLNKWTPIVDKWISIEENSHSLLRDKKEHNWEQIIFELAEKMKDVSIAYAEAKILDMPESDEGKMVTNILSGGTRNLNETIKLVLNRDFNHLLK